MNLPRSPADLTPELMTSALQARLPGARVEHCRGERLTGERGIAGSLLRVRLEGDGLPGSLIAKFPPAHPMARAQLAAMGFFEREVGFYRQLAARTPVQTPTCFAAEFDPTTCDAWLLLEDLAPARNGSSPAAATVEDVTAVLLALARMHARWWEDPDLADHPWLGLRSMLAPSAVAEVFEQAWPAFLGKLSIPIDDEIAAMHTWISSTLTEAATTLFESGPRTLIHNDVQADNVFFREDAEPSVVFVDWQMTAVARGAVDVANAVRGWLEPEVRRSVEPALLSAYHQALVEGGVGDYPLAQLRADYELATVLAPARLATSVGLVPDLVAHPGAPWDTLFLRYGRS